MLKVGGVIYLFSVSHRVYAENKTGRSYGRPIFSKYFQARTITGETKTHWLVGEGYALDKVDKKTMRTRRLLRKLLAIVALIRGSNISNFLLRGCRRRCFRLATLICLNRLTTIGSRFTGSGLRQTRAI